MPIRKRTPLPNLPESTLIFVSLNRAIDERESFIDANGGRETAKDNEHVQRAIMFVDAWREILKRRYKTAPTSDIVRDEYASARKVSIFDPPLRT